MSSMLGRPNMDEELEDGDVSGSQRFNEPLMEVEPEGDDLDGDDSDDWGELTVHLGSKTSIEDAMRSINKAACSTGDEMMFVPEPVMSLLNDNRPTMPLLRQDQLPIGTAVWLVDEGDVKLLLKEHWDGVMKVVCNGRAVGRVVRHSNELTVVAFENENFGLKYSFTVPRACLSVVPVEPYDSPKTRGLHSVSSFAGGGVGNLGPRAGRGAAKVKEDINVLQLHYEVMTANSVVCPSAETAWSLLKKGKTLAALEAINRAMQDDLVGEFLKEHCCVRSTIHLFAGDYPAALQDALKAIELNPSWVKGYLRAARAYKAHGKYTLASHMINQSLLLLPHSHEINQLSFMNDFLRRQQMELEARHPLSIRLDAQYVKRLVTKRGYQPGETMYVETECVLSMPSLFNTARSCCVCLSNEGISEMATPTKSKSSNWYCSQACLQRSSLFLGKELDENEIGWRSAMSLIQAKAASSMNMLPLEQARLTMRLFFIVCTTHQRLRAQAKSAATEEDELEVSVDEALHHLGIFPLVSTANIEAKVRDDLATLCNVLCQSFSPHQKQLYSCHLFLQLFGFVAAYALYAERSHNESLAVVKGYYVGKLCGSVERSCAAHNCAVKVADGGCIALVAVKEIMKDQPLIVAALATTQH